jgi:hypothetical protein
MEHVFVTSLRSHCKGGSNCIDGASNFHALICIEATQFAITYCVAFDINNDEHN